MIINRLRDYWTVDQQTVFEELNNQARIFWETFAGAWTDEQLSKYNEIDERRNKIIHAVREAYITSFAKNPTAVYDDIREVIEAITQEDYRADNTQRKILLDTYKDTEPDFYIDRTEENYINCFRFIVNHLSAQFEVIQRYNLQKDKAEALINDKVSQWYEVPDILPDAGEQLEKIQYKKPLGFLQGLTRVGTKFFSNETSLIQFQSIDIDVTPNRLKKKNDVQYYVSIDMAIPDIKLLGNITEFDKSVFNAVSSIIASGNKAFTARQVATFMLYGNNPTGAKPSKARIQSVVKSIRKMRVIDTQIDYTRHAQLNGHPADKCTIKNYFLPLKEGEIELNGNKVTAYILLDIPPLLEYQRNVNQIAQHPAKVLQLPLNLDNEKLIIRDFLLEEIAHMKGRTNWGRTITFDRIIKETGKIEEVNGDRWKRKRLIDAIIKMLDYWQGEDYINGYKIHKKNRQMYSVEIEVTRA